MRIGERGGERRRDIVGRDAAGLLARRRIREQHGGAAQHAGVLQLRREAIGVGHGPAVAEGNALGNDREAIRHGSERVDEVRIAELHAELRRGPLVQYARTERPRRLTAQNVTSMIEDLSLHGCLRW
jgi:hypothetical protein